MDRKEVNRTDPYEQMAIATSKQALAQSGLQITEENADDVGVYIGSGIGGLSATHQMTCPARCERDFLTPRSMCGGFATAMGRP